MKVELYLESLHQDLIDGAKDVGQARDLERFRRLGDERAWVLCCDGFCCILDFSKYQDPRDLVSTRPDPRRWHVRREPFGGLLWNPHTNRVFKLDQEAFEVLLTLQEGTGLAKATRDHGVSERDLHLLMAQIAESGEGGYDAGDGPSRTAEEEG